MSADSGIATFRGAGNSIWGGMVGTFAMVYFGTPTGWNWTPSFTWGLYVKNFYLPVVTAQPNDGHRALAELARHLNKPIHIITQNVDGLHQTGGSPAANVYEVHGTVIRHVCIKGRHRADWLTDEMIRDLHAPYPKCRAEGCNSFLRPDAVLFGENLPANIWGKADDATAGLRTGDVFMVIGTSGKVQPAASLPHMAASKGARIIECNTDGPNLADLQKDLVFVKGPSAQTLPAIVAAVKAL